MSEPRSVSILEGNPETWLFEVAFYWGAPEQDLFDCTFIVKTMSYNQLNKDYPEVLMKFLENRPEFPKVTRIEVRRVNRNTFMCQFVVVRGYPPKELYSFEEIPYVDLTKKYPKQLEEWIEQHPTFPLITITQAADGHYEYAIKPRN